MIRVTRIKPLGGHRLHATFSDGTAGEHDFSALVQGDRRLKNVGDGAPVLLHCHTSTAAIEKTILERIASVNEYATVAVIFANEQDAAKWHGRLSEELATGRRPASLSRREDLIGRFDIHFTPVFETKGLEFDVVVIPDVEAFKLESEIGRNQLYVAISRAKHALFLGCGSKRQSKEISSLIENGFVRKIELD
jgi:superfamily I DNA/RNA helicase